MSVKVGEQRVTLAASSPREHDDTASGRLSEERLTPHELRSTRLLMWITVASAFVLALVCVVGFQLLLHFLGRGYGGVAVASAECFEGQSPDPCVADGKVCISNRCVADDLSLPLSCQVNDACGEPSDCSCDAPLTCQNRKCVDAKAKQARASVCDQPALIHALRQLREKCAGDFHSCKGSDVKKYLIADPDFDRLMAEFPGTITLHFPDSKPALSRTAEAWPAEEVRNYYVEHLLSSVPALREAQHIFLIARSSPGVSKARNYLVAVERGKLAKDFLLDALRTEEATTVADTDKMRGKFADFVLGQDKQVDLPLFASRYANRYIAWDQKHQDRLRAFIVQGPAARPEDAQWRDRVINQVVFVVPVPCKLDGDPIP